MLSLRINDLIPDQNLTFDSNFGRCISTGDPSSLYEPHKEHNMASNYKGLYGIFAFDEVERKPNFVA